MEKYGVDVEGDREKDASDEPRRACPRCGAALVRVEEANVPKCPSCGTEPFERS